MTEQDGARGVAAELQVWQRPRWGTIVGALGGVVAIAAIVMLIGSSLARAMEAEPPAPVVPSRVVVEPPVPREVVPAVPRDVVPPPVPTSPAPVATETAPGAAATVAPVAPAPRPPAPRGHRPATIRNPDKPPSGEWQAPKVPARSGDVLVVDPYGGH